jgi:Kef-type K+ transport system membrane component KefB
MLLSPSPRTPARENPTPSSLALREHRTDFDLPTPPGLPRKSVPEPQTLTPIPQLPVEALARLSVEDLLLPILIQLLVIVGVARTFGWLARRCFQPSVVGEVIAGLLLGPCLLGWIWPEAFQAIFQPRLSDVPPDLSRVLFSKIFGVLSQIGLILLLFLVGLDFEFEHLQHHLRSALAIALLGLVVPFALGAGLAPLIYPYLDPGPQGVPVSRFGLTLFLGVALSITALPMLGRIMVELGIQRTRIGVITITAAAIEDALGWILLAAVASLVKSEFHWMNSLLMFAETVAFAAAMFFLVRPLLVRYLNWSFRDGNSQLGVTPLAVVLVVMLGSAICTNLIGIFAIFGPFLLGAVLSDQVKVREAIVAKLQSLVSALFVPIFFTYTGLRTEIATVNDATAILLGAVVLVAAIVGKIGGAYLAARWTGFPPREATIIGAMMNTRGLMELIVVNVGYDLGVIPQSLFSVLVIMAVVTTMMTTPIVLLGCRGTELEEPIRKTWS